HRDGLRPRGHPHHGPGLRGVGAGRPADGPRGSPVKPGGMVESILLQLPARLVLGAAFLLAAWMKLFHATWAGADPTFAFAESIKAYKILDPERHAHAIVTGAYVMPWAELLAGLLVLIGLWTRPAAL